MFFVTDVSIALRGFNVCVPHKLLQHAYIDPIFQHGCGKGMTRVWQVTRLGMRAFAAADFTAFWSPDSITW